MGRVQKKTDGIELIEIEIKVDQRSIINLNNYCQINYSNIYEVKDGYQKVQ